MDSAQKGIRLGKRMVGLDDEAVKPPATRRQPSTRTEPQPIKDKREAERESAA